MGQSQSSDDRGSKLLARTEEITLECVVKSISEDSERSSIEEKLKDVICKTVVNIPLTESRPGDVSNAASSVPQSSSSCLDSEGKLLVKVIKASGLSGKDETDIPDPYCIITCREPRQKKKTVALKGTKDPFWNESHELDISKKTKEIAFDIYDELKTSEGKNFHMNGVAGKSNDTDSDFLGQVIVPIAMISKDQPCRLILPVLPISEKSSYVTGQISLEFTYDKDGKAFEASQQARTAPLESSTQAKTTIAEESTKESPQKLVFSMATLDIVEDEDDQLHLKPLEDHGVNREDIVMAERRVSERLPLSSSDETAEENDEVALRENEKHKEMLQELIEVERRTCEHDRLNYEEEAKDSEREVANDRPASREPGQSPVEVPPCRIIITPSSQQSPSSPQSIEEDEDEATSHVDVDQKMLDDLTPGTRRKVFREAFSMRINRITQQSSEDGGKGDERKLISHTENRHETADDETTPKSKSFSEVSLTSLYEGTKSVLVVETKERGEVKYYQIPPLMAKRGTFDYKGTKLHVCNDHLFVASHFSGTLPSCYVCKSPLTGYFGKQGYECRALLLRRNRNEVPPFGDRPQRNVDVREQFERRKNFIGLMS